MFNPNSAFPRQTTYVPFTGDRGVQRAVNAPNFGPGNGSGVAALPSLYGRYAANAQRAATQSGGAPGVAQGVAALAAGQYFNTLAAAGTDYAGSQARSAQGVAAKNQAKAARQQAKAGAGPAQAQAGADHFNSMRRLMGQGKPALPEVAQIDNFARQVLGDSVTPISANGMPSLTIPTASRSSASVTPGPAMGVPQATAEQIGRTPQLGRTKKSFFDPNQTSLF